MSEGSYEAAVHAGLIVTGSPRTIIQKFKHIIDRTDPGYLTFWAREGKKPHDATMRGIELLGKEVIPQFGRRRRESFRAPSSPRPCDSRFPRFRWRECVADRVRSPGRSRTRRPLPTA